MTDTIRAPNCIAASFPEGDFLASVVTPIYLFLKREVSERAKDDVSSRVMYDDVNESFWSRATVHALLPHGCGHVPMPEREISCEPLTTSPYYIPLLHPLTTSQISCEPLTTPPHYACAPLGASRSPRAARTPTCVASWARCLRSRRGR